MAPPPGATQLAFKVDPPSSMVAGVPMAPAIVVEARDANNTLVADFTGSVTLSIETNPGGGTLGGTTTVTAVGGVATFSNVSINKTGNGYRLKATSGALSAPTSVTFTITAASADHLTFATQPSTGVAGANLAPAVVVKALDALGNVADGYTGAVTLAITSGTGTTGAVLSGTTTTNAVAGVATFADLNIDLVGPSYTLSATGASLPNITSTAFNITPGLASLLIISVQPSATVAGQTIAPAVEVTARDNRGNVATGFNGIVTLGITPGTGSAGATLGGTVSVAATAGVASFGTIKIAKAGLAYTLSATATGVTAATTGPFDIAIGPPAQLVYGMAPTTSFAGAPISPAVQVLVQDAAGNTDTTFTGDVTVTLAANPGSASLSGTTTVAAVAGVATFSDLSLDKAGTGYTLLAGASGIAGITSPMFDNLASAGNRVVFLVQPPASVVAGTGIAPSVQVAVQDTFGNTATAYNGDITLAIGANPGSGTLAGTVTVGAVGGIAIFPGLSIDRAGNGYTLTASASVLTIATSSAFDIVPGPAHHLLFGQQPASTTAGVAFAPSVTVQVVDQVGNVVPTFSGDVTLGISVGTGTAGATLAGSTTATAAAGIATFTTLSINKSGTAYTLLALSSGLTSATSGAFDIAAGPASQLAVAVQPVSTTAGDPIAPAIEVRALDAEGNLATTFGGDVTLAISSGTGTAGATLSGAITVPAANGVASFSGLSIDKAGLGYTLAATASGLTAATSSAFDIMVGVATKLAFTVQPGTTVAGVQIAAISVTAQDAAGNTVPGFAGDVTVSIGNNPAAGTLSGTATATPASGVASFGTLNIDKSGVGYTLVAKATGLTDATSAAFDILAGPAAQLTFTVQPSASTGNVNIAPAVVVTALDQLGNVATGFTGNVTMALGTNPSAGVLSGTTSVAAVAGVATFSALKVDKAGVGYTLAASANGTTGATSAPFDITVGVATKLAFTVAPINTVAGVAITPAVEVTAQDAAGNTVPSFVGSVTVAITAGTGTTGALLRGTTTVGGVLGVAQFSTLNIDKSGNGYKLTATSTGLTSATSVTFNVTVGPLAKLGFTVQPASAKAGAAIAPTIRVAGQDSLGNTVTTFVDNVTMVIGTNPSLGVLSGTVTVKASSGVASFSTLKIDKVGVGYTLIASAPGAVNAVSLPFNITPANASLLLFTAQPLSSKKGQTIPAVTVTAMDPFGNVATGFTSNITVALGANPNFGALTGTLIVKAVAGVSSFSTLKIDSVGVGYTLTAAAVGLTGATSAAFDITTGQSLAFTVQPTAVTAGSAITPAVQVTARDSLGAPLTTFTGSVTIGIAGGTGTAGAILSGGTAVAVAGVATFPSLIIDRAGTGFKLVASASTFSGATSNAFTVNTPIGGTATKLGFIVQPTGVPAGSTIIPAVVVAVQDVNGVTVGGVTGSITIGLASNPAGGVLTGTLTVPINAGTGSFSTLVLSKAGTYTLSATSLGLTSATSAPFTIAAAATIHLVFSTQPAAAIAGQFITPGVQVTAQNASNATVTSFTGPVTVQITAGTGANGATLSGTTTVSAVGGVATFSNLSITKAGTGFKLSASSPGTAGVNSASFAINADVAVTAHFATQPVTTLANAIIPAFSVDVRDQFNNVVKTFSGSVTVSIASGTGTGGAVLSGTKTITLVSGVATFSDLSINLPGSGNNAYRLSASVPTLTSALSNAFAIN